jgi:hypothetical protein
MERTGVSWESDCATLPKGRRKGGMKGKNFIWAFLVLTIAVVGIWWFMQMKAAAPEKIAVVPAPAPAETDAPKPIMPASGIAPPAAPPVGNNSEAPALAAKTDAPIDADPQSDLKTAIPDLARMWDTDDLAAIVRTYAPPDELAKSPWLLQHAQDATNFRMTAEPDLKADLHKVDEREAQELESIENQTPTFNDAGDKATYTVYSPPDEDYPNGEEGSVTFVKINGKWYLPGSSNLP